MRQLIWTLRVATLWVGIAVLTTLHMILEVSQPGAVDELRAGTINGMDTSGPATAVWVLFAVVPLAMAFSTLVLPDRPNRWANGLVGGTLAAFWALEIVGPTAGATLLVATVVVMGLLIAWHAWA